MNTEFNEASASGSCVILFLRSRRVISINQNHTRCPNISEKFSYHGNSNNGGVSPISGSEIIWTNGCASAPASKPCHSLIFGNTSATTQYPAANTMENMICVIPTQLNTCPAEVQTAAFGSPPPNQSPRKI